MMVRPRVKICCISTVDEAHLAIKFGASALGLVGEMPSGPGVISDEEIREIAKIIPPPVASFLLTSQTSAEGVIDHCQRVNTNTVQIVDNLKSGSYSEIKAALPNLRIVQVIHVLDENSVDEAVRISSEVDAILLDSGNPNLQVKELGGTGRTHNWELSRKIVEKCRKPVFLAGGLKPENVRQAVEMVQPFGLDLCSGVRTDGKLDEYKLEKFFSSF